MGLFSFLSNQKKESSGMFIPDGSNFVELTNIEKTSINDISKHLGYNIDMIHTYMGIDYDPNSDIQAVAMEIFTNNIVFIFTSKEITDLSHSKVKDFLKSYNLNDEFDATTTEGILEDGINNESFTCEYLSKVLNLNDVVENGVLTSEKLELNLYFKNGMLESFQSIDGLNHWAKDWKNQSPHFYEAYKKEAEHFWGKNKVKEVTDEINIQADSYANVPASLKNPYCDLHKSIFNNINFANLIVAHHGEPIELDKFLKINHGRYQVVGKNQYQVGRFVYGFSEDGTFMNATQLS